MLSLFQGVQHAPRDSSPLNEGHVKRGSVDRVVYGSVDKKMNKMQQKVN